MSEAIQQDVSRNPREAELEEIANRLHEGRGAEPEEETEEEIEEEIEEEPQEAAEDEDSPGESAEEETPEEELVTIKVNGQEQQVPLSKIKDAGIRTFQKETAADKRLQEAAEREKAIQQRLQQIEQFQRGLATQQGAPKQDADDQIDKWVEAIQFGEKDDARAAIKQIMAAGERSGPSGDEILQHVELRLHNARIQEKFKAPPEAGGFGDLCEDPNLYAMCSQYVAQKRQQGDTRLGWEIYEEAGKAVRGWRDSIAGKVGNSANLEDKKKAKRKLDTVKTTSARQVVKEEKEPSRADILAEMKAKRAQ